jgi:hypothetical protein
MFHLSSSVYTALLGTLLCTLLRRTSSLKVLRDSDVQNLTYENYAYFLSSFQADEATSDNATRGASISLWGSNVSQTTTAWPRRDQGILTLLKFPPSVRKLTMSIRTSSFSMDSKTITRTVVFVLLCILCIGLAVGCAEKVSEESSSPDLSRSSLGHYSDHRGDLKLPVPLVIEGHDGDWSKKYRWAERTQKQALDLLYLCKIIPVQEFLHAKVSQDHIDECVWIANAMLKQKTLREWLDKDDYAREFFNSCVTALYEARADIKDSQRFESPGTQSGGNSPENQQFAKERVPLKRLGTNMLLDRCREIMAGTRRDSLPKSSPERSPRMPTNLDLQ